MNRALGTESLFCAPEHSWEKGSVEQVNGLIRRFFPKGTNFHALGQREIHRIEKLLNNRPRKCLDYRTPYDSLSGNTWCTSCLNVGVSYIEP